MKHLRRIGAFLALAATLLTATASLANAEIKLPETLPKAITERTLTGDGSKVSLQTLNKNGTKIECATSSGTAKEKATAHPEGSFSEDFTGCKAEFFGFPVGECKTAGDAKETILKSGNWLGVLYVEGAELRAATYQLDVELTVECAGGNKIVVKGGLMCAGVNPTVRSKDHEGKCEESAAGSGDPRLTSYYNDKGEAVPISLLCSTNGGAFETCAGTGSANILSSEELFGDI